MTGNVSSCRDCSVVKAAYCSLEFRSLHPGPQAQEPIAPSPGDPICPASSGAAQVHITLPHKTHTINLFCFLFFEISKN